MYRPILSLAVTYTLQSLFMCSDAATDVVLTRSVWLQSVGALSSTRSLLALRPYTIRFQLAHLAGVGAICLLMKRHASVPISVIQLPDTHEHSTKAIRVLTSGVQEAVPYDRKLQGTNCEVLRTHQLDQLFEERTSLVCARGL
jgi:hypothetical protein